MQAAVCEKLGEFPPLTVKTVQIPTPNPGQALIRVLACGICHTDLHGMMGDWPNRPSTPYIPGHEVVGTIQSMGADCETPLKVGDRVGVPWLYITCTQCEFCTTGKPSNR